MGSSGEARVASVASAGEGMGLGSGLEGGGGVDGEVGAKISTSTLAGIPSLAFFLAVARVLGPLLGR